MYFDPISWKEVYVAADAGTLDIGTVTTLMQNIVYVVIEVLLLLVFLTFVVLGWSYAGILQLNVYRNYFEEKKLPYKKNVYFDVTKFYTYSVLL